MTVGAGRYAVGVDLGGTDVKLGLVDERGETKAVSTQATHVEEGPETGLERIARGVETLLADYGVPRMRLVGLGVGAPGPATYSLGLLHTPANLKSWQDFPLRDRLAERLDLATVFDNDANLAALGEAWVGAGHGVENMVHLTLGTGVGSGIILNGELLRGRYENAGELGHMIIVQDGRRCGCGQRGCLEAYASATAAAEMATEAAGEHPDSALGVTLTRGGRITSKDLFEAVRREDETAQHVWDRVCRALATACVNIQHALNVELVVLGGGMADAGATLLECVKAQFAGLTWRLAKDQPRIELARLGNGAGLIGAGKLVFDLAGSRQVG